MPKEVTLEEGRGGLRRMVVRTSTAEAVLYLHGAHLTHYQPSGEDQVLWMSRRSFFEPGKPIRGGIPICFPWFGRHPSDPDQPIHGLARLKEWKATRVHSDGTRAEVDLTLTLGAAELLLSLEIGPRLKVSLGVTNLGDTDLRYTEALHSFFHVSDIRKVRVHGLEDHPYTETAAGADRPGRDLAPVVFEGEVDRPYIGTRAPCVLEDPGLARRIRVVKAGSNSTILWNPWVDKARGMEDFGDDEWKKMVCLETANSRDDAVTLPPGETHCMSTEISVERT